jgi:hypothetical protein
MDWIPDKARPHRTTWPELTAATNLQRLLRARRDRHCLPGKRGVPTAEAAGPPLRNTPGCCLHVVACHPPSRTHAVILVVRAELAPFPGELLDVRLQHG